MSLAFDGDQSPAWPTYLYYNPHPTARRVQIDIGAETKDLYDGVAGRFIGKGASGQTNVDLAADSAAIIVIIPAEVPLRHEGNLVLADARIIDFVGRN